MTATHTRRCMARNRVVVLFMLFCLALLRVAAQSQEPDTTTIARFSDDDFRDAGLDDTQQLRVVSFTPVDNYSKLMELNADSLPLTRSFPALIRRFVNSWTMAREDRTRSRRLDMSYAISPSYTRESSFGIGGTVTGLFRIDRNDTLPQPSIIFATAYASLNGFYVARARGNLYFPDNRNRINFEIEASRKALHLWGFTIEDCNGRNRTKYSRRTLKATGAFIRRFGKSFFLGSNFMVNYTDARELRIGELLHNERSQYFVAGIGPVVQFDTRDVATSPSRGIYASYEPLIYPDFTSNARHTFYTHRAIVNAYKRVWPGGILAMDIYGRFTSRHTPWTMREMIASDGIRMRGYYMGSYTAQNQVALQAELRQHIFDRLGAALWVGGCDMFEHGRHKLLPNGGVGIRLLFKPRVSGRIDIGFGRHTSGVLFSVGEAF